MMDLSLRGRVALITGASRGIGFSIARELGQAGAEVVICARSAEHLKESVARLKSNGISARSIVADVTDPHAPDRVLAELIGWHGRLDILVNNAGGIPKLGTFTELDDADWMSVFDLNVVSAVRFTRAAIPHLRKSPAPRIINLSSVTARQPGTHNPHYAASKLALVSFAKYMSNFLAPDGIMVNTITPGIIHTEGWDDYIRGKAQTESREIGEVSKAENARARASVPANRLGTADEVAGIALFLASGAGSFVTGAEFVADGGKTRCV